MKRDKDRLEEIIKYRVGNLKSSATTFRRDYKDEDNAKMFDSKVELLESILEEYYDDIDKENINKRCEKLDNYLKDKGWYLGCYIGDDYIEVSTVADIMVSDYGEMLDMMELLDMRYEAREDQLDVEIEDEFDKLVGYKNCYYFYFV